MFPKFDFEKLKKLCVKTTKLALHKQKRDRKREELEIVPCIVAFVCLALGREEMASEGWG